MSKIYMYENVQHVPQWYNGLPVISHAKRCKQHALVDIHKHLYSLYTLAAHYQARHINWTRC